MHRDLKPQNLLISKSGYLKIADFGLARTFSPSLRPLTAEVITRWYRAPEILLGCNTYTLAVDNWSVACIIAEMASKIPLLPGDSDIDQIHKIFHLLGTPGEMDCPGITEFPLWRNNYPDWEPLKVISRLPNFCPLGCDLIEKLMAYNPLNRITAIDALEHPYLNQSIAGNPNPIMSLLVTPRSHIGIAEQRAAMDAVTVPQQRLLVDNVATDSVEASEAMDEDGNNVRLLNRSKSYNISMAQDVDIQSAGSTLLIATDEEELVEEPMQQTSATIYIPSLDTETDSSGLSSSSAITFSEQPARRRSARVVATCYNAAKKMRK